MVASAKTNAVLLSEYMKNRVAPVDVKRILFDGVGGRDVYNITAPFSLGGESVIAGRVEERDSEDSEIYFFREEKEPGESFGKWVPKEGAMKFRLQDPFFTFVDGEFVVGGVQTYIKNDRTLGWRTIYYRGYSLPDLKPFFIGPDGMKDLRIVQLADKKIGVLTRPQGKKGGRGKIGYVCVDSLEDLCVGVIADAPIIPGQFAEGEWGGSNEAYLLKDGTVGVLGHIASFENPLSLSSARHYYAMTFQMNPCTRVCSDIKLLAVRSDFLPSEAKRPALKDVVFSGGLVRHDNGMATLYAGIGDADAQCLTVKDPFAGL